MQKIAVFFGGDSSEHEISVITGLFAANLLRGRVGVVPVYLPREGGMCVTRALSIGQYRTPHGRGFLAAELRGRALYRAGGRRLIARIDAALNCCHGGMGEDGTLAALLEWNGVPSASPGSAPSAVFMNKEYSKLAARGLGIPVVRSLAVHEAAWRRAREETLLRAREMGELVIVKPSRLGSSIGVETARGEEELAAALDRAFRLDDGVLVEEYLSGRRDVNCAAWRRDGEIVLSPCEEVFSHGSILSYREKYEAEGARRAQFPAELPAGLGERIRGYTAQLYEAFSLRGVVRADFLVAGEEAYFNELNTVPGSLACYLFGASLTQARSFLLSLLREAALPCKKERIRTGILQSGVFSGAKGCKRSGNLL